MDFSRSASFICLVLFAQFFATMGDFGDRYFILRNPHSGHVMDASEEFISLKRFTGFSSQQWKLEPAGRGMYYIMNRATEKVLDVDHRSPVKNAWLVLAHKGTCGRSYDEATNSTSNMNACQQWFVNYDGTIVNSCGSYAVEIRKDDYTPGVYLETWEWTGKANQKWVFQYV